MAERWEVVFDFAPYANRNVTLKNSRKVQSDEDFFGTDRVMRFVVGTTVSDNSNNGGPPSTLSVLDPSPSKTTVDKKFTFERK